MSKPALAFAVVLPFAGLASAHAAATRVFVSGHGADSGTCGLATPCRSFAYALTQVAAGGEVAVLDTAGYGAMTISQAVSIVSPGGVEAGITVTPGGTAISINAGSADKVSLRGLTIEGGGNGANGIVLNSAGSLDIADCVVRNFQMDGIAITPVSGVQNFNLNIKNVTSNENGGSGFSIQANSTNLYAQFIHIIGFHDGTGLSYGSVYGGSSMEDSAFSANGTGLTITNGVLALTRVTSAENSYDMSTTSGGRAFLSASTIQLINNGGSIFSFGNNSIDNVSGNALSPRGLQ